MIDTIRVNLADTSISDSANIQVQPGFIDLDTGLQPESDLFVTKSKKVIKGKKAFINNDFFNLTILPKQEVFSELKKEKELHYYKKIYGRSAKGNIELDHLKLNYTVDKTFDYNSRIFLQSSLPKINSYLENNNTYNLKSLNEKQILNSVKFLNDRLQDHGINTNLDESYLSRIDLFNNIETSLPFSEYKKIYSGLHLSRKILKEFAGETFLYGNKQNQVCIYDKLNELLQKHKIQLANNTTRIENRFLNKRKIFNTFKGYNLKMILNTDLQKDEMNILGNKLFNKTKIEVELINQDYLYSALETLKENNRYWLRDFFYREGLNTVLSRIPETILLTVLKDLLTKDKFYKIKREIQNFSFNMSVFSNSKLTDLYDELKTKYFNNLKAA